MRYEVVLRTLGSLRFGQKSINKKQDLKGSRRRPSSYPTTPHQYESWYFYNSSSLLFQHLYDVRLVRQPQTQRNAHQHRLAADSRDSRFVGHRAPGVQFHDSRKQHREPYQRRAIQPDAAENHPRSYFSHGVHDDCRHGVPHGNAPVESHCRVLVHYRRCVLRFLEIAFIATHFSKKTKQQRHRFSSVPFTFLSVTIYLLGLQRSSAPEMSAILNGCVHSLQSVSPLMSFQTIRICT